MTGFGSVVRLGEAVYHWTNAAMSGKYAVWLLVLVGVLVHAVQGKRYNYCSEGCCPEEYCAYKLICYPKIHCSYGCPDGQCYTDICMPHKPCTGNSECGFAHACTMNYNLGYKTCQYNLEIGKTLCVDRDGNSLTKPIT